MEDIFYKLNTIQKVNLQNDLFYSIENKIAKQNIVSKKWVCLVAAILILFVASEYYFVNNFKVSDNSVAQLLISKNNKLPYYVKN